MRSRRRCRSTGSGIAPSLAGTASHLEENNQIDIGGAATAAD